MKKSELIEMLECIDGDPEIILARDAEGNSFSPLSDLALDLYLAENTWTGEVYDLNDPDAPDGAEKVVCLWPTY